MDRSIEQWIGEKRMLETMIPARDIEDVEVMRHRYDGFDAKQAKVLLAQQEHLLSKDEMPSNLEQAESAIKRHETFMTTVDHGHDGRDNGNPKWLN